MTNEKSQPPVQPEREVEPRVGLFNIEAMSDEQVTLMARSLAAMSDTLGEIDTQNACNAMLEGLGADVRSLAQRNPERVKGLVETTMRSDCPSDQELAAYAVAGLIDHDYSFTREALVYLYCDTQDSYASEAAYNAICKLANERLTAEQRADFNACLTSQGVSTI
ncbi:hypothetical protein [Streptomyces sp. NBC_00996]|uniref:hypothetical protein n=1 Tax=Streptomyces sp. NBC_00996 TaxID=2903710 RepID=UPI00386A6862|nr:hypothetical protein OG390_44890 [Streptomyces sp. NBC_00996]